MKLTVKRFQNAPFFENGYVAINESDECVIIDPGGSYDDVLAYIKDRHCQPIAILLTHGHCDHVAGVGPLHENLQIPVYLHERDYDILEMGSVFWSFIASDLPFHGPDKSIVVPLNPGLLELGDFVFEVLHTPGHSPGSCLICCEDVVFTGDTILANAFGRTDLVGGDSVELMQTLSALPVFPDNTVFFPGHGDSFLGDISEFTPTGDGK